MRMNKYLFIHSFSFLFCSFHITAVLWSSRFDKRLDVSSWTSVSLRMGCPSELIVLIRGKRSSTSFASYHHFVDSFTDPLSQVLQSINQSKRMNSFCSKRMWCMQGTRPDCIIEGSIVDLKKKVEKRMKERKEKWHSSHFSEKVSCKDHFFLDSSNRWSR